jgi:PAT family beta-lactamase induction signal transducer AmpG
MSQVEPQAPTPWASRRMVAALLLGFSSGLPLLATGSTLQAWMTDSKVDLGLIGLYAFVGTPYTLKFVWAPIFDRFALPFLGKRRGWILVWQLLLSASFVLLSAMDPTRNLWLLACAALLVSFLSASQDIVIDAWRREILTRDELALGSSLAVTGYRLAMLVSGALALYLADHIPWSQVYQIIAVVMLLAVPVTLFVAQEPEVPADNRRSFYEMVVAPLGEFLTRPGAMTVLLFILCYKLGDIVAVSIATPYYMSLGFQKTDIAFLAKTVGLISSIAGGLIGGSVTLRIGISRALWIFGVLQAVSIVVPMLLTIFGPSSWLLAAAVASENLAFGMGMSAYTAYMAEQANTRYTASQLALLTSLMGIPRVFLSSPAGYLAKSLGWVGFFVFCIACCIPGLLLLRKVAPWTPRTAEDQPVTRVPSLDGALLVAGVSQAFLAGAAAGAWTSLAADWSSAVKVRVAVSAIVAVIGLGALWERNLVGAMLLVLGAFGAVASVFAGVPWWVAVAAVAAAMVALRAVQGESRAFDGRLLGAPAWLGVPAAGVALGLVFARFGPIVGDAGSGSDALRFGTHALLGCGVAVLACQVYAQLARASARQA